jgi:GrpB-like predicted nucleotidyltransferase (UPF0157 family)
MHHSNPDDRWRALFAQERTRLLAALGDITVGGIIEHVRHIGATSVAGLPAWPCVDIGLAVWPFPLAAHHQAALESLGYERVASHQGTHEQRFSHISGAFQLLILEAGSELWTDFRLIGDYLRHDAVALRTYSARKQAWVVQLGAQSAAYQAAKTQYFLSLLDEARRWWVAHQGFAPVEFVAQELADFGHLWHISGGWALDLYLGHVTRVHEDVDVVIARTDQPALYQHLTARGWRVLTPVETRLEPWSADTHLDPQHHQVLALRDGAFIDFQLSDIDATLWHYRRAPAITQPSERIGLRSANAIPFLAPEIVLLFKSQNTSGRERLKDQGDFEQVELHLQPERRAWLLQALLATDPEHAWIQRLIAA